MHNAQSTRQERVLEIELMKAIALLSPVLAIVSNIWVNILIALFVLLLSYYGGKLLKKTNWIRV